ncbi:MAG: S9 family peptidase [Bacteroidales bacterium]|nr:S9 family peptidase [Bacteroidales bacterium]
MRRFPFSVLGLLAFSFSAVSQVVAVCPAQEGRMISPAESQGKALSQPFLLGHWTADGDWQEGAARQREWRLPVSETPGIRYGGVVSRNEFDLGAGSVIPSPDSSRLLVFRTDERAVAMFPLPDIRTGSCQSIRYPMNGQASERVGACVCDTCGHVLATLQVDDFTEERYLTGAAWSPSGRSLFVQVLDRSQHHLHLNQYRSADGAFVKTILTEDNDAWVEPLDRLHFLDESHFIYRTDNRDGYRNLYLCDVDGHVSRLTPVDADVQFVGTDGYWVYYTSAGISPLYQHLFRLRLRFRNGHWKVSGKPERLTKGPLERWHDIRMNPACTCYVDICEGMGEPRSATLMRSDGTQIRPLLAPVNPLSDVRLPRIEQGTVKAADGETDNYYRLLYPCGLDTTKKYPLIVYVYGGPHSQMVTGAWMAKLRHWELVMAQRGYAVYVQDNRGTTNRGAAFEKAVNRRLGAVEMADQMAGLSSLLERCPWIDRGRIGVHGWSFGGFMAMSLCVHHPGVFKAAVAGGPVIDWTWYEVMYGERYMDTPATNAEGFAATSLLPRAKDLRTRLLICQGVMDDTVVWQHSLGFVQACVQAGVPVEYFPYPCSAHNMSGKARLHLYEKITAYFLENL